MPPAENSEPKVFVKINSQKVLRGNKMHLNVDALVVKGSTPVGHKTVIFEVAGKQKQEITPGNGLIENYDLVFDYIKGVRTKLQAWAKGCEGTKSEYDITPANFEGVSRDFSEWVESHRKWEEAYAELSRENELLKDQLHTPITGSEEFIPEQELLERAKRSFEQSLIPWEEAGLFTPAREKQGYRKPDFDRDYKPLIDRDILQLMCDGEGFYRGYNRAIWVPEVSLKLYLDVLRRTLLKAFFSTVGGKKRKSLLVGADKQMVTAINPEEIMKYEGNIAPNPDFEKEKQAYDDYNRLTAQISAHRNYNIKGDLETVVDYMKAVQLGNQISAAVDQNYKVCAADPFLEFYHQRRTRYGDTIPPSPISGWKSPAKYAEAQAQLLCGIETQTGGELRLERDQIISLDYSIPQPKTWKKGAQYEGFPVGVNPQNLKQAIAYLLHCLTTEAWIPEKDDQKIVVPYAWEEGENSQCFFPTFTFDMSTAQLKMSWVSSGCLTSQHSLRVGLKII